MKVWGEHAGYGIAVPGTREWVNQIRKIPNEVTARLQLWRYLVRRDAVTTIEPGMGIPDWGRGTPRVV